MCGIVGVASSRPIDDREGLVQMRDTMTHRGPDDRGVYWSPDGTVGLGHRRLAIIDLSPGGHQPMSDPSGKHWVTFNGEIYNYQDLRKELVSRGSHFRTSSDTEVLLAAYGAWGTDCVDRLNGMFSFCIYDAERHRLFLARDRAGEKPLFYASFGSKFVFASELKAILSDPDCPRILNPVALHHFLAYGYVPRELSILKRIHKLPAACAMTYDVTGQAEKIWNYWRLPRCSADDGDQEELARELERLLEDSVRRRLVADVPVGILLSGGLDSSLVTAVAAHVSPQPVRTFTITFRGDSAYNEGPYARLVARHFGTSHTELTAEPATLELLPALAEQYDEPMADSSMIPTFLVSRLIRSAATVALGGDGGDELFAGYRHYVYADWASRGQALLPRRARSAVSWTGAHALPIGLKGRHYLIGLAGGIPESLVHCAMLFDRVARSRLLAAPSYRNGMNGEPTPESYKAALCVGGSVIRQATALDFMTYLTDDILVKVDRASMVNSLEIRCPWLDHRLIEFAFGSVPDRLRKKGRLRKILVRRLARKLLPPRLDIERKQGFSIPLTKWLTEGSLPVIEEVLSGAWSELFSMRIVRRLIAAQKIGYADNAQRLFALTLFELWRRRYRVSLA
jgi:asparagine synthase (glutamine-hydrolysing)